MSAAISMHGPDPVRVLLLEDSPSDAFLVGETLKRTPDFAYDLTHATTLKEAVTVGTRRPFDVVLLDLGLPDSQGVDTFREFDRQVPGLAVLVLTVLDDAELGLVAVHEGAQDYISKNELKPSTLGRAVRYAVERNQIASALERSRDRLRMLAARVQTLREDECKRISREFHDVLGQKLTAMKMDLHWINTRVSPNLQDETVTAMRQRILDSQTLVDEIIGSVQQIAFDLRPSSLDHLGLVGAIREESRRFEARTGIAITMNLPNRLKLEKAEVATAFFRIYQELLSNIARHAGASNVVVTLRIEGRDVVLVVVDDGKGIEEGALEQTMSLGVLGMQERAAAHGGTIQFTDGEGAKATVRIAASDS